MKTIDFDRYGFVEQAYPISEVIKKFQELKTAYGDLPVFLYASGFKNPLDVAQIKFQPPNDEWNLPGHVEVR